jgi:hypothetical protein
MQRQVHFTLHLQSPAPGRYRKITIGEQTDGFELLTFEGSLASVQPDWQSVNFPPTRAAACVAAYREMRESVAAGWILVQSVER